MPRFIVRLAEDEYVMWSTVTDAPITWAATREMAVKTWGAEAIEKADKTDIAPLLASNRAGPGETRATLEQLREDANWLNHGRK